MQDTCIPNECRLFDLLGGTVNQCPNFQESWWTPENSGKPILVKDCAPRRTFLMVQDLSNRMVGVQKASEQSRNLSAKVQVLQEALGKNLSTGLTQALNAITCELKTHINKEIENIKNILAITDGER
uniref:Uncharacterized protein n=1 Tax=viral metagenome TaxID=1070528 RepID=A0A6M3L644_9ZZZZ